VFAAINKGVNGVLKHSRTVVHYAFVPFVLYLGFQSAETQPGLVQLFLPV